MVHTKVLKKYKELIKSLADGMFSVNTEEPFTWFPNGYNSIRIRYENRNEFVFTYHDDKKWRLETGDYFIEKH
jgi:Txe/YoeB family toxin of Txe-Axe toxin-antitoxin module